MTTKEKKEEQWTEYLKAADVLCKSCEFADTGECMSCPITNTIAMHNVRSMKEDLRSVKRELKNVPGVGRFCDSDPELLHVVISNIVDDNVKMVCSILENYSFKIFRCEKSNNSRFAARIWFSRIEEKSDWIGLFWDTY